MSNVITVLPFLCFIATILCIVVCVNPVFAILYFLFIALISLYMFIVLKNWFMGVILLIIYVGVIAVLFLFTVIVYQLKKYSLRYSFHQGMFLSLGVAALDTVSYSRSWVDLFSLKGFVVEYSLIQTSALYNEYQHILFLIVFLLFIAIISVGLMISEIYNLFYVRKRPS